MCLLLPIDSECPVLQKSVNLSQRQRTGRCLGLGKLQQRVDGRNIHCDVQRAALETQHGVAVQLDTRNVPCIILAGIRSRVRWAGHVARGEMRKPCRIVAGLSEVCQDLTVGARILLKTPWKISAFTCGMY